MRLALCLCLLLWGVAARAEPAEHALPLAAAATLRSVPDWATPELLRAMGSTTRQFLEGDQLGLAGGFYSSHQQQDLLSQFDPFANLAPDRLASFERDPALYALVLDGTYALSPDAPVTPFFTSGVGMALYAEDLAAGAAPQAGAALLPIFRLGGGLNFQLGTDWDLSLSYRAGFSNVLDSAGWFTDRTDTEDLTTQQIDAGLKVRF